MSHQTQNSRKAAGLPSGPGSRKQKSKMEPRFPLFALFLYTSALYSFFAGSLYINMVLTQLMCITLSSRGIQMSIQN